MKKSHLSLSYIGFYYNLHGRMKFSVHAVRERVSLDFSLTRVMKSSDDIWVERSVQG